MFRTLLCLSAILGLSLSSVPCQDEDRTKSIKPRANKPKYKASALEEMPGGLVWSPDIEAALAQASKEKKLVLVAFEALTSVYTPQNHLTVFVKETVKDAVKPYVLVVLYVDVIPTRFFEQDPSREEQSKEGQANKAFQGQAFDTFRIPHYAVVKPLGGGKFQIIAQYDENRINDVEAFIRFLREPFKK